MKQHMDPRSNIGIFSRGKPVYRGGFTSPFSKGTSLKKPKPQFDVQLAVRERLNGTRTKRSK